MLMARDGEKKAVAIIGGGITGLAAAFHLQQCAPDGAEYTLIEASSRLGGKIISARENGFLIEGGPDSFLSTKTATMELCRALGLNDQLIGSNHAQRPTYVWSRRRLHPMPEGMMMMAPTMVLPFLRSRLVSWPGKLRMGMEVFVPRQAQVQDESLASFVRRRLGSEALEKIAAPLMAGIHAADPERLSLQSTFPAFQEMERKHGSLIRGMVKNRRKQTSQTPLNARRPMFTSLRDGLQTLVEAILVQLPPGRIRLNCRVLHVAAHAGRYGITLDDGSYLLADDLVLATPAYVTAELVEGFDPVLASALRAIRYVSTATVSLGFRRSEIPHSLDGFGFVVSRAEKRKITACSWSSEKFEGRAPGDCALLRVFVGGAGAEEIAEREEAELVQVARQELRSTMGIHAAPLLARVYRWPRANPQYDIGHRTRIAEIERMAASHSGLHLAGAAYHGAGIPDCIQSGREAAARIAVEAAPRRAYEEPVCIQYASRARTRRGWE